MSAIAGILHTNGEPVSPDNINTIMESLLKFPADDIKIWKKENIFLGCHAQWITPESINEPLPFYDNERKVAITADAIIDNRDELFQLLQVDRSKRTTVPDSQLILLSYYKWGEEAPKYLIGDFAFMIWDEKKQKLFGARDFSGSRTLYYFNKMNSLAFCTIIEPLLALSYVENEINDNWLAQYLAITGMIDAVDASQTVFKDVQQLPPSHSISIQNKKVQIKRYCLLAPGKKLNLKSDGEYVEAFQEVFQKAVKSRLRTHHNVGAQLSGGLDSGSIVSYAVKELRKKNKPLHTFSYVPPKDFIDFTPQNIMPNERPFIESTVKHVGGIKDYYLDFKGRNSYSEIDSFLELMEMPYKFFENSFWLKGMFEEAHNKGIGVLLNGGRGNLSISWGSAIDYYAILLKKFKLLSLYQELNHYSSNIGGPRLRRLPSIAKIAFPFINAYFSNSTAYKPPMLINPEFASNTDVYKKLKQYGMDETGWFSDPNIYKQRQRHFEDVFHWNASNTVSTKLSLKYGLWKRDPTNDIRVIRFCLSVPEEQFVQKGMDRALVRRSTENYLPDNVRLNQQIHGVQGADWVHRMIPTWSEFTDEIKELLKDERASKYLNLEVIQNALLKIENGVRPEYILDLNSKVLMRSLIVYKFLKRYI